MENIEEEGGPVMDGLIWEMLADERSLVGEELWEPDGFVLGKGQGEEATAG